VHFSKSGHVGAVTILHRLVSVAMAKNFEALLKITSLLTAPATELQPKPVHIGLLNAHQGGLSDRPCFARTGASNRGYRWERWRPSCSHWGADAWACNTCTIRKVSLMRIWQACVHRLRMPLSATKTS